MLLGARKIRRRLCRQQFSLPYTPKYQAQLPRLVPTQGIPKAKPRISQSGKNRNFSNSCKQFIILDQVDESDDFLPWLEWKAGAEISSALSIGKSANGTSLFASKSITAGDCVLKVPYSVQLAPDNLVTELKDLLSDGVGDAANLATVVLFEQRMSNDSGWAPYIRWLPRPVEMHCTIFWSDDELELIRQSFVYQETINQRSQIKKEILAIRTLLLKHGEA